MKKQITYPALLQKARAVIDFPIYMITDCGKVINIKTNRILKINISGNGYETILLCNKEKKKRFYIHRLVAIHFIDNPENKRTVNHKDGNKENNNVANLEWLSDSENNIHAFKILGRISSKPMLNKFGALHNRAKKVLCSNGIIYSSLSEAGRALNIRISTIGLVCQGKLKNTNGLNFKYA